MSVLAFYFAIFVLMLRRVLHSLNFDISNTVIGVALGIPPIVSAILLNRPDIDEKYRISVT